MIDLIYIDIFILCLLLAGFEPATSSLRRMRNSHYAKEASVSARIELATSELTARRNNHYAKKPVHL